MSDYIFYIFIKDRKRRSVQADKKLPLDENAKTCETPATGQESGNEF